MKRILLVFAAVLVTAGAVHAKIDLVTLPGRDSVQLTIYNLADLTLVKESRVLTLKKGLNRLQLSWANTLIDPTSLEIRPKAHTGDIDILSLTYPPRVRNLGVWNMESAVSGKVPVEISYLTSGLAWRAFYIGTLSTDEKTMALKGYVRVSNRSGEGYEDAQTRLIVGKVNMLDEIAVLARRSHPYGKPRAEIAEDEMRRVKMAKMAFQTVETAGEMATRMPAVKKIEKEGISEYFLYTIEGRETIADGWSKRLPSFEAPDVPVVNLYKFEEERFGRSAVRFLAFANDKPHRLGDTPIPGGTLKVFRTVDGKGHLSYEGQSGFKYIPVGQKVELSMGSVDNVMVEPVLMKYATDHYMFHKNGDISGWDEIRTYTVNVKNTRNIPVTVEILRNFSASSWEFKPDGDYGTYEKVDLDTMKFTLTLPAISMKTFSYVLRIHHGKRAED
jgi:hypothetical protein